MADKDTGYEVGYRRPPKHSRFKPGQSGNRKGRPPRRREALDVAGLLDGPIPVSQAGAAREMSGFEVGVRKLVSRALKDGDLQAALEFLRLCEKYRVIVPAPVPPARGNVLVIPKTWDHGEWMAMLEKYGPPPWPGPQSGLPESQ
jgi:hypothetical protein